MFGRHKKGAPLITRRKGSFMLLIYLLATLVSSFLLPQKTQALPTAALPGSGIVSNKLDQIYYNGVIFSGPNEVKAGDSLNKLENFSYAPGTVYYVYIRPTDKGTTDAFLMGINSRSNPTKGQYVKLSFNTDTKTYSNVMDVKDDIALAKGEIPTVRNCNIPWIGWIVCPLANALATALDDLYQIVTDILVISPIDTTKQFASGQDKPIYAIWSIIRGISNVVFVILFIIVILSHITGFGLSNYTIKKIFPRLIVTAVLVNLSLTICVLLVDIFNLLGYSVADIFLKIQRSAMPESDLMAINAINWAGLLASVYGAGSLVLALNGGIVGATLLVLGGMAGALATIVAVVIALSARQALVIILTVVSPLAFVLNLLPNTEEWFSKWWKAFIKIQAIFPIFALIYGASQLASSIIIQTANDSFILILVGLIVKVIPFGLLITIIKSSDHIMDRITNAASNSTKSIGEGAQEYLRRKQEIQKLRYESGESKTFMGQFTPRGMARSFNQGRRRDDARLRAAKANQDALYSRRASLLNDNQRPANADAREEIAARVAEANSAAHKQEVETAFSTIRAKVDRDMFVEKRDNNGKIVINETTGRPVLEFRGIEHFTDSVEYEIAKSSLTKQIADREAKATEFMQQEFQNLRIVDNITVPQEIGHGTTTKIHDAMAGINTEYKSVILSDIIQMQRKERADMLAQATELIKQLNLSEGEVVSFATGKDYMGSNIIKRLKAAGNRLDVDGMDGKKYILDANNEFLRAAAALKIGSMARTDLHEYLQLATINEIDSTGRTIKGSLEGFREEIADAIWKSGVGGSNLHMGVKTPDYIRRGVFRGFDTFFEMEIENIVKGRYSVDKLVKQDKDAMTTMARGLEAMVNRTKIQLTGKTEFTGRSKMSLGDWALDLAEGKVSNVRKSLDIFEANINNALTNPQTAHLIQPAQEKQLKSMLRSLQQLKNQSLVTDEETKERSMAREKILKEQLQTNS